MPATIHIGIARHVRTEHVKVEKLTDMTVMADFSHEVIDLGFGPQFPGLVPVLNGRQKSSHQSGLTEHYQYDVHVIPTTFQEDFQEIPSHQYSVTEYVKAVDARNPQFEAAASGIWMTYDFTPFEVRVTMGRKSLFHFFTECCAILGGIFVPWSEEKSNIERFLKRVFILMDVFKCYNGTVTRNAGYPTDTLFAWIGMVLHSLQVTSTSISLGLPVFQTPTSKVIG